MDFNVYKDSIYEGIFPMCNEAFAINVHQQLGIYATLATRYQYNIRISRNYIPYLDNIGMHQIYTQLAEIIKDKFKSRILLLLKFIQENSISKILVRNPSKGITQWQFVPANIKIYRSKKRFKQITIFIPNDIVDELLWYKIDRAT